MERVQSYGGMMERVGSHGGAMVRVGSHGGVMERSGSYGGQWECRAGGDGKSRRGGCGGGGEGSDTLTVFWMYFVQLRIADQIQDWGNVRNKSLMNVSSNNIGTKNILEMILSPNIKK